MTQAEFMRWSEFYRSYPFDDFHRFHRPAALIARSFSGGEMRPLLEWLQPREEDDSLTDADRDLFRAAGAF